jgi:hypothetical protein
LHRIVWKAIRQDGDSAHTSSRRAGGGREPPEACERILLRFQECRVRFFCYKHNPNSRARVPKTTSPLGNPQDDAVDVLSRLSTPPHENPVSSTISSIRRLGVDRFGMVESPRKQRTEDRRQSGPPGRAFVVGNRWSVAHVILLSDYCLLITRSCQGEKSFAPTVGEAEGQDGSQFPSLGSGDRGQRTEDRGQSGPPGRAFVVGSRWSVARGSIQFSSLGSAGQKTDVRYQETEEVTARLGGRGKVS